MKEGLKSVLVLAILIAVSVSVLSYVHRVTAAVRAQTEGAAGTFLEPLQELFPATVSVEKNMIANAEFKLAYDAEDILLGSLVRIIVEGSQGNIIYSLVINSEGEVIDIIYHEHTETVGIGTMIEEEPFINQIIGLGIDSQIEAGGDIDTISGATESSLAMINSIGETIDSFEANFLDR